MIAVDAALTQKVIEFNLLPSRYLHVSQQHVYLPETLIVELFTSKQVENHLSRHILKTQHLENTGYFDEAWPYWPLTLASINTLENYAKVCGGLLLRHSLQHSIQREIVNHYRQQLGYLYHFILEKGPLLYPHPLDKTIAADSFLKEIEQLGWHIMLQASTLFPQAVKQRFMLKLPYSITTLEGNDSPLSAEQAASLLIRISYELGVS